MTREGLGRCVEECDDQRFQTLILEDTSEMLWEADCEIPLEVFTREDIAYSSTGISMSHVLDMSWSACCNGLN